MKAICLLIWWTYVSSTLGCDDGDVRLVNGTTSLEGLVEICRNNDWGTAAACVGFWGSADASVVCRQLGFSPQGAEAFSQAAFGQHSFIVWLDTVHCVGTESRLVDCSADPVDSQDCLYWADAGVRCMLGCADDDIRLVSEVAGEGRVEFCHDSTWGTVCDDFWDSLDATVVCRQLGFSSEGVRSFGQARFGQGLDPIWLDTVNCVGTESRLADCPANAIGDHDCVHGEDAGVRCTSDCSDGDVRLVGGDIPEEGRVEFCHNDDWGTVCDDSWDDGDASVVCRQLGLSSPERALAFSRARFGEGFGPIFLYEVRCAGTESRLADCPSDGINHLDCSHSEDAGVSCTPANSGCSNGDIRLVGGYTSEEGRVEFCDSNEWGTVCNDFWGISDASVVCRQLGFSSEGASRTRFGQGSGPILLDNVNCDGTESGLADCRASPIGSHDCSHSEDAGVRCQPADSASVSTVGIIVIVIVVVILLVCIASSIACGIRLYEPCNRNRRPPRRTVVTTAVPSVAPTPVAYSAQPQQASAEHSANKPPEEFTASDSELRKAPPPSYEAAIAYPSPTYLPPSFGEGENYPAQLAPFPAQGAPYPAQVPTPPPAPYPSQTSASYPTDGQLQGPANPLGGVQSAAYPPTAGQDSTYPPNFNSDQ